MTNEYSIRTNGWIYRDDRRIAQGYVQMNGNNSEDLRTLVRLANAGLTLEPKEPDYHAIGTAAHRRFCGDPESGSRIVDAVLAARDEWEKQR